MNYYAGIGSRSTPNLVCQVMNKFANELEKQNYILRSGGAEGADKAFESGVLNPANKEIFLPWQRFNNNISPLYIPEDWRNNDPTLIFRTAHDLAQQYHPGWYRLTSGAKRMMMRNMFQVLGKDLKSPVSFIICWTKDGGASGGTGQALRFAHRNNIKIYNLYNAVDELELNKFIMENRIEGNEKIEIRD